MQFKLTEVQLNYLNNVMRRLIELAPLASDLTPETLRVLAKLKYKFTPNTTVAYLTLKDRTFLTTLLAHRQNDLMKNNSITEEVEVVQSLIEAFQP